MFLSIVLSTLCSRVASVISKDGVYALVDIIIVDPIHANLFTSNKFQRYCKFFKKDYKSKQQQGDQFIPFNNFFFWLFTQQS
jgi:deoxyribodipyrimidine photolyase-like uncharacterized protein